MQLATLIEVGRCLAVFAIGWINDMQLPRVHIVALHRNETINLNRNTIDWNSKISQIPFQLPRSIALIDSGNARR